MNKHYRQNNGVFWEKLPEIHYVKNQFDGYLLTEQNASEYGYEPAENYPQEYGHWLIESGVFLSNVNDAYKQAVAAMVKDTPEEEQKGWPKQELEAKAYSADNNAPTPYVDWIATGRGIPRAYLLDRILAKVALYEAAHGYLTGLRQAAEDALNALDKETVTHTDVFALMPDFTLPSAEG